MAAEPETAASRRAPLDGLRALAVTAVVVYHFGGGSSSVLPGGFLGVDLFFVLSGYLITGLLVAEHRRTGRIDLGGFWARRVRRLLPALVAMLLAVCAWVWWAAPPQTWQARRDDVLWTITNLANWHFVSAGEDYFVAYSGASPLRHTWSLSIEEQFYLAWPLLVALMLAVGLRLRRSSGTRLLAGLAVALVVASAVAMAWSFDPASISRAYYGTDGRVQQLLVGALLAIAVRGRLAGSRPGRRPWAVHAPGIATLLAVVAAVVLTPDDAPAYYRGGALAFALAGAGLILAVEQNPDGAVGRLLSLAPAVALGRISYAVYLWHWPVLVAVPVVGGPGDPGWWLGQSVRVLVTVVLSGLSYVLIERPVLEGRLRWVASLAPPVRCCGPGGGPAGDRLGGGLHPRPQRVAAPARRPRRLPVPRRGDRPAGDLRSAPGGARTASPATAG